jgi:hypothetical protein
MSWNETRVSDKECKSNARYVPALHRDIGFFLLGVLIVCTICILFLADLESSFVRYETTVERNIPPGMDSSELEAVLDFKNFKVLKADQETIQFENGVYNRRTGAVVYSVKDNSFPLNKKAGIQKISTKRTSPWSVTGGGALLLFLTLTTYWMANRDGGRHRRGVFLAGVGGIISVILLFLG